MAGAGHPARHHLLRGGVAVGDVLAVGAPGVPGAGDAFTGDGAVGAGVGHVAGGRHVLAVILGGLSAWRWPSPGSSRPCCAPVDQLHDPGEGAGRRGGGLRRGGGRLRGLGGGFGAVVVGAGAAVEGFGDAVLGFGAAGGVAAARPAWWPSSSASARAWRRAARGPSWKGSRRRWGSRRPPATGRRCWLLQRLYQPGPSQRFRRPTAPRWRFLPLSAVRPVGTGHGDGGYADDADGDRGDDRPPVLLLLAMDSHTRPHPWVCGGWSFLGRPGAGRKGRHVLVGFVDRGGPCDGRETMPTGPRGCGERLPSRQKAPCGDEARVSAITAGPPPVRAGSAFPSRRTSPPCRRGPV